MPTPVVVDVETTGFGRNDRIVEIAAITLNPVTWETIDEYDTLINPERDVGPSGVHGISASMVEAAPTFTEIIASISRRLRNTVLIAHNLAFDTRMLQYEFERRGVAIDPGAGLCTYLATRKKLVLACKEHKIPLCQQHRALADARATAELARKLRFVNRTDSVKVVDIGDVPQKLSHHTLRRGLVDAGTSPMYRVVSCASYPSCDSAIQQYLDMLDWVLDDGVIDDVEHSEIERLARELGISEEQRMSAHRDYLNCIISAARRDQVISAADNELIARIAGQLGLHHVAIPEITHIPPISSIPVGSRVCFTGAANKSHLESLACNAGFEAVRNVSKKGCDFLIAADIATSSSKARNARKWAIPIISLSDFVDRYDGTENYL
ncbi:MAG: exonuclease domain-containing protein [Halieaceae bacterium]|nr:exonuclease domain-containing protein [Halieaceae bacterium]